MIWFTSDFHFNDTRMLETRPLFDTIDEMETKLIARFNERVSDGDTVWLLGDIAAEPDVAVRTLSRMNGDKKLVIGNHDRKWISDPTARSLLSDIQEMCVMLMDGIPVTLCHYPLFEWYKSKYTGVLIHGHMHGKPITEPLYRLSRAFDVSVENTDFYPVSWEEIRQKPGFTHLETRT